jgi:2-hydroxy-6-oxonona-2,4-dienedioate hydrolase
MVHDQSLITPELIDARWEQAMEPNTLAATRQIYSREGIGQIAAMREQSPTRAIEHLASIQAPTLLTWGRDDRVTPLDAALLPMRLIPLCELHTFPRCGHWAMIECKQAFETLVMSFLCRQEPEDPAG